MQFSSQAARVVIEGAHIRSFLDAGIILNKPDQLWVDNLAESNSLPIAPLKLGVSAFRRRVVEKILQGLLCEGRLSRCAW